MTLLSGLFFPNFRATCTRHLGPLLILLGLTAIASGQNSCLAACKSSDSPCAGLQGAAHARCVSQCEQKCRPRPTPTPLLDPGCGDRNVKGRIRCTIYEPEVRKPETPYTQIQFAPGDIVDVTADGCVQTGGVGDTWKRYVNPLGGGTDNKYHGLIRIPTAQPAGSGLIRIEKVIGRLQTVTGTGLPISQLFLHLGYEDDDYSDNGYYSHDDGNSDQCKISGANDGGPAHVTITIFRGVPPQTSGSRFDFDVLPNQASPDLPKVDPNGFLYNPQFSWQQRPGNQGKIPATSQCHEFSERPSVGPIPLTGMVPSFADCTDQADGNSVDLPDGINAELCGWRRGGPFISGSFIGHVNWFPITLEGEAGPIDHNLDDDYSFSFRCSDNDATCNNPAYVNDRFFMHVEFDSDETIDHFSSDEWNALHSAVDNSPDLAKQLFAGHTIITGMFGLDGEHNLKSELHPLYALATRRDNYKNLPQDDVWLIFVRNRGDEGFCSSQLWDSGFEDYTFHLPWLANMTSVDVNWNATQFEGTEGTSGPTVAVVVPPAKDAGVYVSFHLGPASSSPFIDGALHLVWTGGTATPRRAGPFAREAVGAVRDHRVPSPQSGGEVDEVEHMLQASINQLTPEQRLQVRQARVAAAAVAPRPAVHRLTPGGPVRKLATAPLVTPRIARRHAIKAGPAVEKTRRDAAQIRALCAATHNAPPGLPTQACTGPVRDHR